MTQSYSQEPDVRELRPAPAPVARPRIVTATAVLAFAQALFSALSTGSVISGLLGDGAARAAVVDGGTPTTAWIGAVAQVVGIVLLVVGGARLLTGRGRTALVVGAAVEIGIVVYYLITSNLIPIDIAISIFFTILPAVVLVLALGRGATGFLASRRTR